MSMWKYDVHISFGAGDPCKEFAYLLYNGLKQKEIRACIYDGECFSDTGTGDNHFLEVGDESMISIELIHPECASLSDSIRKGVDLLKSYHDKFLLLFYGFSPRVWKFGEALDINEAAYGDEVQEWKKAVSKESCFYGCDIIDMTEGYESSIAEIIVQSSKMIQQESLDRLKLSTRKYDMFLTYRGDCKDFVDQLYNGLEQKGIQAYRDDIYLSGPSNEKYHEYLDKAYENSRFWISIAYQDDLCLCFYRNIPHPKDGSFGGAKAYQWMIDLSYATTIPGRDFAETTNGYQSSIDEFIKRIRKILRKESSGRKGFEMISFLGRRLSVFWDIKSSPFPTNVIPEDIAKKIKAFVIRETNNNWEAVGVYAYGRHSSAQQKPKLQNSGHTIAEQNLKLHNSGVTLIHTPQHGRKDTTYIALLVDMFKRSHDCPPPSSIMLITGNISYANALHALWLLGHKIILVTSSEVVSVPLMNASIYTWSEPTSSSQVQIEELSDDDNNWPGSNLDKREDLVATSSSQCEELRMRCEEFVSIDPFDKYLYIFWDLENCPIPGEVPTKDVALYIRTFVTGKIDCSSPRIRAYGDFSSLILERAAVRESLEKSGVNVINTPHVKKDAADEAMIIDLFMYSKLVPSPSSIMVITGDVDFATTLHAIGGFGHDIYLVIPSRPQIDVSKSLTSASKDYWYWSEVAYGIDLTGLKGQLEELLKSNGGQLRLGSLDAEYEKMFEKPLCLSDYKADNLVNLLERMSYMISVEVSKKGKKKSWDGETLVKLKG